MGWCLPPRAAQCTCMYMGVIHVKSLYTPWIEIQRDDMTNTNSSIALKRYNTFGANKCIIKCTRAWMSISWEQLPASSITVPHMMSFKTIRGIRLLRFQQ